MGIMDRVRAFMDPAPRTHVTPMRRNASYGGASTSRLYQDWYAPITSADYEIRTSMRLLRARARQLVRDNAYAAGFIDELANNVVGPGGIRLEAMVSTTLDELHDPTNDAIESAWVDFCNPENVSADGIDDMTAVQRLAIQTWAQDGEAIYRKLPYFENDHLFALTQIDADRLDEFYNMLPTAGQNEIRMGVEIDQYGKPLFYHIWNRHPTDGGMRKREKVPADQIIHLFTRTRPGQTRGVTWFAPVLTSFKMLDGYTEAELVAARTAAAKMGFIETTTVEGVGPSVDPKTPAAPRTIEAAAGIIEELGLNQHFQEWDPKHPSTAFKEFSNVILRGQSRGLGMSYMTFTGDLNGTSYSSGRIGLLPERDHWKSLQGAMAMRFCRPVYRAWVPMARLAGALKVDGRIASDLSQIAWRGRGWAWVDPLKDMQATILGIQHGIDSRTDALTEQGLDLETTFQHLSEEIKLAEEYGIDINPVAPPIAGKSMGQPSKTDQEEGGDQNNTEDDQPGTGNDGGTGKDGNVLDVLPQLRALVALK